MRRVIIESPYAGDVERNVRYARRAMRDSFDHDELPFASHLLYTQDGVLDDKVPEERAKGIEAGLLWSRVSDAAIFYVDHGWSPGMLAAKERHEREGRAIEYRTIGANK